MGLTRFLADYRPWPFTVRETRLDVTLSPRGTRVRSALRLSRTGPGDLVLDGGKGLRTRAISIDGRTLDEADLSIGEETLTIGEALLPDSEFTFAADVEIDHRTTRRWRGCICPAASSAPSARPRAFATSPGIPTAPT